LNKRNKAKEIITRLLSFSPPLLHSLRFTRRFIWLATAVRRYESRLPFKGIIGENRGFYRYDLSNKTIYSIKSLYKKQAKTPTALTIGPENIDAFQEIFSKLENPVIDYLGKEVKLDGINFFIRSGLDSLTQKGFSTNWHTDNVGVRLKVFLCFDGDGTQPTIIIPPKKNIPSLQYLAYVYFLEVLRWLNIQNKIPLKNELFLNHRTGTVFVLDTNVLHRGSWVNSTETRHLLQFEFSNPDKHELMKGILEGPIGTKNTNSFSFHKSLSKLNCFYKFIDNKRSYKQGLYINYRNNDSK